MSTTEKRGAWRSRLRLGMPVLPQVTRSGGIPAKDMTGLRFGRLVAVEPAGSRLKMMHWRCACDCGTMTEVAGANLRSGRTKSCGCLVREIVKERHRQQAAAKEAAGVARPARKRVRVAGRATDSTDLTDSTDRRKKEMETQQELRPPQPLETEILKTENSPVVLARAMRRAGARWREILEVTGVSREEVEGGAA